MTKESSAIRNLALIGHGASGKTTLCETLLLHAGLATRVPAGLMDSAPDEKERGHSIDLAVAKFSWNEKEITVLDVPGYQEFYHNAVTALAVVESAVVVISASDGITVNTRRVWKLAEERGLPRLIVLTKLDGENVNFDGLVENIQKQFGPHCVPFIVPNDVGAQLSKVYGLLSADAPQNPYREKLIEAIAETDDELCSRYLEGEAIGSDEAKKHLRQAVLKNQLIPIITVVSPKRIGIKEFFDCVDELLPAPVDVPPRKGKIGDKEAFYPIAADAPCSAQVFKIHNDPFGRIVYLRIFSGTMTSSSTVYNVNGETSERLANILQTMGKEQKIIDKAIAGEIIAVAKFESVKSGDTLVNNPKDAIVYERPKYPMPMVSMAVLPKSRGDEQKIIGSLGKLSEEDATFWIKRAEETGEMVISGMSNLHLELMLNRLKSRFKVECVASIPKIPYRETITGKAESRFRHKKQTGGHGQFAEVAIKIEPAERGAGFEFVDQIVGGVIPAQFVTSTEKGVVGIMKKGILAGCPVVDVRVILFDGKTHDVDSSDAAFQIAASRAFQEAFMNARPVLLEPIQNLVVTIPSRFMGEISGNLNSRRGRIMGSDTEGDYQVIKAQVPLAEVLTYSTDLKSMTGGEGNYTIEFSHYDAVPSYLQDKIVARAKEEKKG